MPARKFHLPHLPRVRITRHHLGRRRLKALTWLVFMASMIAIGYALGRSSHPQLGGLLFAAREDLIRELQEKERDNARLLQLQEGMELSIRLYRQAQQDNLAMLRDQREQITDLHKDLHLYQEVMDPSPGASRDLRVHSFHFYRTASPLSYRYRLVVHRRVTRPQQSTGYAQVALVGEQDGSEHTLPLNDLSEEITEPRIRLSFRYAQRIEGTLTLPEGFVPRYVDVVLVREQGNRQRTRRERIDWATREI